MKKIYNIILVILVISAILVIAMIILKYGKNYVNEKKIENVLYEIDSKNEENNVVYTYEGYNIEGIIEIPKINIKYPILSETNEQSMKISVTKFWGPDINEIGNYTIAGHNNRDGTMFGKTKHLEIGDIIRLTDKQNSTIEYEVFKIYSIDPNDVSCVESVDRETREVTLITCTNGHKNRLIIKARERKN